MNKDIEGRVGIAQGIYGLTYKVNDVGNTDESIAAHFGIIVSAIAEAETTLVDSIYTGSDGFYERALPAGRYRICSAFGRCVRLDLGTGIQRCDFEFSVGSGWLCGEMDPPPAKE